MSDNPGATNAAATADEPVCTETTPQPPLPVQHQQQLDEGSRSSPARQHQNGGSPATMAAVVPSPDTPRKRGTNHPTGELL
ncbi:unnamed protein product [Macrosiphum euphorbiae]|uniref:Uncharacterized protein n=1 Tax=Macrosiphum euphorbiae TaxID=13131 RepID=A0AAV0W730_9HEMI|nr:unnamed protein product [Macrosiphum euphorbiae]